MKNEDTDVAVVGGGLTGVLLCEMLTRTGRNVHVFEARDRLGGRILGLPLGAEVPGPLDAGPAWVWPHNLAMLALLDRLKLQTFPQYATGRLVFEDPGGAVRRDLDFSPMAGTLRVKGGLAHLIDTLAATLAPETVHLSHAVERIGQSSHSISLAGQTSGQPFEMTAQRVVLTLPPRLVAQHMKVTPQLPPDLLDAFAGTPTWMAGHAKFLATYDTPFWRANGLSGDAMSHRGPMAEVHDASPDGSPEGALFGFLGMSAEDRQSLGPDAVKAACVAQLSNLFGEAAANPNRVYLQDWASESFTATGADWIPPASHPDYRRPTALSDTPDARLLFAGSELAPSEGGFLEGAVRSAEAIAHLILRSSSG